jgi:hypothetical protein
VTLRSTSSSTGRRSTSPPYAHRKRVRPPIADGAAFTDGNGPTAKYPYLPEPYYSCRPGGPRVYDLIALEPMEPFGVLGWAVEEHDEGIFEVDDWRDEDKAMQALWARWIFLNRSLFFLAFRGIDWISF